MSEKKAPFLERIFTEKPGAKEFLGMKTPGGKALAFAAGAAVIIGATMMLNQPSKDQGRS